MNLEVSLTPELYAYRTIKQRHATVVIDLLRATTALCAAFQAGCSQIVPIASLDGLEAYRSMGYAIAAERGGQKVQGADYGNSPTAYLNQPLNGLRLVYTTTNGTRSILAAADAEPALIGSLANLDALVARLRELDRDVVLLCSGWEGNFCLEDTITAGAIIARLADCAQPLGDAAIMARSLWEQAAADPAAYCSVCSHVARLQQLNAAADVSFAFQLNTCPVVPVFSDGKITL